MTAPVLHWPKLFEGQVGLKKTSYGWENDWGDGYGDGDGNGNGKGYGYGNGKGYGYGFGNGRNG